MGAGGTLKNLLEGNRSSIVEKWFNLVVETYPAETSKSLHRERDRFVNPVGHTISREIEALYGELLAEMDIDRLSSSLNEIIKIRSIQDFPPSQAIGFVFLLKKAIRDALGSAIRERSVLEEWSQFQSRIDRVALLAFDLYMKCREKICEIRVNEARAQRETVVRLLERIGYKTET